MKSSIIKYVSGCANLSLIMSLSGCLATGKAPVPTLNKDGKKEIVNAASFGFNTTDSTVFLQKAINSGARKVIIPKTDTPWISGPLRLRSNQEIFFEEGAVLRANDTAFRKIRCSLLNLDGLENVVISGYGARIEMNGRRYSIPPFYRGEFRHIIRMIESKNVKVFGITVSDSGGDGIIIGGGGKKHFSEDIYLKDLKCIRNFRQGLSVISVKNLVVENCLFAETAGTPPSAGVDLEPEDDAQCLENVVFRNCTMRNNQGSGFMIYALKLTEAAKPFSIKLENCVIDGSWEAGFELASITQNGPRGTIDVMDCEIKNTFGPGILIREKASDRLKTRFINCKLIDTSMGQKHPWAGKSWAPAETYWRLKEGPAELNAPIVVTCGRPHIGQKVGNIEFLNCDIIRQNPKRPTIILQTHNSLRVEKITGSIRLFEIDKPVIKDDSGCFDIDLSFTDAKNKLLSKFQKGDAPEYHKVKSDIKIETKLSGEYSLLEKGKTSYNVYMKPELKKSKYRLSFFYKTAPDFYGTMLLTNDDTNLYLKPNFGKWQKVELDNITTKKSGKLKGQILIKVSPSHNKLNKVAFKNWSLSAAEE